MGTYLKDYELRESRITMAKQKTMCWSISSDLVIDLVLEIAAGCQERKQRETEARLEKKLMLEQAWDAKKVVNKIMAEVIERGEFKMKYQRFVNEVIFESKKRTINREKLQRLLRLEGVKEYWEARRVTKSLMTNIMAEVWKMVESKVVIKQLDKDNHKPEDNGKEHDDDFDSRAEDNKHVKVKVKDNIFGQVVAGQDDHREEMIRKENSLKDEEEGHDPVGAGRMPGAGRKSPRPPVPSDCFSSPIVFNVSVKHVARRFEDLRLRDGRDTC